MAHKTLLTPILIIAIVGLLITDSTAAINANLRAELPRTLGGYKSADVNDPTIKDIAAFATAALTKSQKSGQLKLIQIVKAETQVIAGVNYNLTLKLATVSSNSKSLICQVIVFEQPWTNTREVTQSTCE